MHDSPEICCSTNWRCATAVDQMHSCGYRASVMPAHHLASFWCGNDNGMLTSASCNVSHELQCSNPAACAVSLATQKDCWSANCHPDSCQPVVSASNLKLSSTATAQHAFFRFDLVASILSASSTKPCMLEGVMLTHANPSYQLHNLMHFSTATAQHASLRSHFNASILSATPTEDSVLQG